MRERRRKEKEKERGRDESVCLSVSQLNSRALLAWETCANIAKASEVDIIQR